MLRRRWGPRAASASLPPAAAAVLLCRAARLLPLVSYEGYMPARFRFFAVPALRRFQPLLQHHAVVTVTFGHRSASSLT